MTDYATHCCEQLTENVGLTCGKHDSPHDCPDVLLVWSEQHREWGLPVRDGGSSWVRIDYCPWCAASLPVVPCSCGGIGWVDDENWFPEFHGERRSIGSGRIPCGFCNEGDWTKPDPVTDPVEAP